MSHDILTAETLATEIRNWLRSEKASDFICARDDFEGEHKPKCVACLLLAAARELEKKS